MEFLKNIQPVSQKARLLDGKALVLTTESKFCITAPEAEKGPAKTALQDITALLESKCGNCFAGQ